MLPTVVKVLVLRHSIYVFPEDLSRGNSRDVGGGVRTKLGINDVLRKIGQTGWKVNHESFKNKRVSFNDFISGSWDILYSDC